MKCAPIYAAKYKINCDDIIIVISFFIITICILSIISTLNVIVLIYFHVFCFMFLLYYLSFLLVIEIFYGYNHHHDMRCLSA